MSRGSKPLSLFVFHRRTFPRTCRSLSHHRRLSSTPSISHFLLLRFRRCPLSFSFSFSYALLFVLPPAFFYFLPYSLTPPFLLSLSPFRHYISPYASILFHLLASLFSLSLSLSLSLSPHRTTPLDSLISFPLYSHNPFVLVLFLSRAFARSASPYHALERFSVLCPFDETQRDYRIFSPFLSRSNCHAGVAHRSLRKSFLSPSILNAFPSLSSHDLYSVLSPSLSLSLSLFLVSSNPVSVHSLFRSVFFSLSLAF